MNSFDDKWKIDMASTWENACRNDADKVGYCISRTQNEVIASGVPYRKYDGQIGRCQVMVRSQPGSDIPVPGFGNAPHTARVIGVEAGFVYNRNGEKIGNIIEHGDDWCTLSIKYGTTENPKEYQDVWDQLLHYVYVISEEGAADRMQMKEWHEKLNDETVGIVGLGGTGSYILDLVCKSGIEKIIIWDGDRLEERNTRRGIGAAKQWQDKIGQYKAEVFGERYSDDRYEIEFCCRNFTEHETERLRDVTFLFIAVDQSASRNEIRMAANTAKVPYIDVGLGFVVDQGTVTGGCQSVICDGNEVQARELINDGCIAGGEQAYRMVHLSEMHALNAALAVMMWRRFRGQYRNTGDVLSRYDADWNTLCKV